MWYIGYLTWRFSVFTGKETEYESYRKMFYIIHFSCFNRSTKLCDYSVETTRIRFIFPFYDFYQFIFEPSFLLLWWLKSFLVYIALYDKCKYLCREVRFEKIVIRFISKWKCITNWFVYNVLFISVLYNIIFARRETHLFSTSFILFLYGKRFVFRRETNRMVR